MAGATSEGGLRVSLNHLVSLVVVCGFAVAPFALFSHDVEHFHELTKKHLGWIAALGIAAILLWQPRHDVECMDYLNHNSGFAVVGGSAEDCRNVFGMTMGHTIGRLRINVSRGRFFGDNPVFAGQKQSLDLTPEAASLIAVVAGLLYARTRERPQTEQS